MKFNYLNEEEYEHWRQKAIQIIENLTPEILAAFFLFLKRDGLDYKKSERLWQKTILNNLLLYEKKTMENFIDFLIEEENKPKVIKIDDDQEPTYPDIDYGNLHGISVKVNGIEKVIAASEDLGDSVYLRFKDGSDITCPKSNFFRREA